METKQPQTPLKPHFPLRWILGVMAIFLIAVVWVWNTSSAESTYQAQTPLAEQHYKDWITERDQKECLHQKEIAQANYNDVLHGLKVDKDMNSLKAKMEKSCEDF